MPPHPKRVASPQRGPPSFFLDGTPAAGYPYRHINVDTTKTITHVGLCAGYGGIELGLKRVLPSLRTVALCEIEAFACANLVAKMEAGLMDPAPIWTDLKTFPWESFRDRVDILTGGYPCQPFSSAGKRLGTEDPRHLWPYIASGIRILKPAVCLFENVEGHITLGLSTVISDLEELGYKVSWGIFSASEVGAPHQRKRLFILAHRSGEGLQRFWSKYRHGEGCCKMQTGWGSCNVAIASGIGSKAGFSGSLTRHEGITGVANNCSHQDIWPARPGQPQHAWEPPRVVGNAGGDGWREDQSRRETEERITTDGTGEAIIKRQTQPALGRNVDGPASGLDYAQLSVSCDNRTDELRLLGNGVVPATAALAFSTLLDSISRP